MHSSLFCAFQTHLMLAVPSACTTLSHPRRISSHGAFICRSPRQYNRTSLQGVGKELVHLGNLGRDGEVDGPVANLDNQSSKNLGVDLVCMLVPSTVREAAQPDDKAYLISDLQLLALANVGGLGDGSLQPAQGLVVQRLNMQQ